MKRPVNIAIVARRGKRPRESRKLWSQYVILCHVISYWQHWKKSHYHVTLCYIDKVTLCHIDNITLKKSHDHNMEPFGCCCDHIMMSNDDADHHHKAKNTLQWDSSLMCACRRRWQCQHLKSKSDNKKKHWKNVPGENQNFFKKLEKSKEV